MKNIEKEKEQTVVPIKSEIVHPIEADISFICKVDGEVVRYG